MTRRTFLQALATALAATAVVPAAELLTPALPSIDWEAWNRIEMAWGATGFTSLRINGVSRPDQWAEIAKHVALNVEEGWIAYGAYPGVDAGTGIKFTPDAQLPPDGIFGFTLKRFDIVRPVNVPHWRARDFTEEALYMDEVSIGWLPPTGEEEQWQP